MQPSASAACCSASPALTAATSVSPSPVGTSSNATVPSSSTAASVRHTAACASADSPKRPSALRTAAFSFESLSESIVATRPLLPR